MATIGAKKQEEKISKLAKAAKSIFPDIDEMSIKGAFRYGAKSAIEKSRFSKWAEIVELPESERRKFFDSLIQEARLHFESMLNKADVDQLVKKLKAENEKYIKQ